MQIVLNGVEFELDVTDAVTIDKLPIAVSNLQGQIAMAKTAVEQCDLIDCFVSDMFGDDSVRRVFKGKRNVLEYVSVIETMFTTIDEQVKAFNEAVKKLSASRSAS